MVKLWVDDVRPMPEGFDMWAETYEEAIAIIKTGKVTHIDLDHDLGEKAQEVPGQEFVLREERLPEGKDGTSLAREIYLLASERKVPRMTWIVHSMNPVGRARITEYMNGADWHWTYHERHEKEQEAERQENARYIHKRRKDLMDQLITSPDHNYKTCSSCRNEMESLGHCDDPTCLECPPENEVVL